MATINNTTIVAPGRTPFTVPGALSETDVRTAFGAELGLSGMTATVSDNGALRTIEFAHRTGNKG